MVTANLQRDCLLGQLHHPLCMRFVVRELANSGRRRQVRRRGLGLGHESDRTVRHAGTIEKCVSARHLSPIQYGAFAVDGGPLIKRTTPIYDPCRAGKRPGLYLGAIDPRRLAPKAAIAGNSRLSTAKLRRKAASPATTCPSLRMRTGLGGTDLVGAMDSRAERFGPTTARSSPAGASVTDATIEQCDAEPAGHLQFRRAVDDRAFSFGRSVTANLPSVSERPSAPTVSLCLNLILQWFPPSKHESVIE